MGEINIKGALLIIAIALMLFIAGCSACSYYMGSKRTIRLSTSMERQVDKLMEKKEGMTVTT